ncbi:MAG TPA: 5-dehydro-4-deoxy-D-glucuronate isomerase [Balneolaceae bacterium]|nr:5-dehydro-4-deoxy-D-glucuronate isomerase [Balneolaceae bacterium]
MATNYSIRFASNPSDVNKYQTEELRRNFLIKKLFSPGDINLIYSHYDRFIVGGAQPESSLSLETIDPLKSENFLDRRELGIINVGKQGQVVVDGKSYELQYKEALYVGRGTKEVSFEKSADGQPLFYLNSAPAHKQYPTKKISQSDAHIIEAGTMKNSNQRTIRQLIVQKNVQTCQLQMGMTELQEGCVWNTMPPHVHNRRMETYFYFEVPDDESVCHFMGEPKHTRPIWLQNNQAAISPPWSIHCGAGTSNYTFIWGMAGENLDYDDMDGCKPYELR